MMQILSFLEKHPMTGVFSTIGGWVISIVPTHMVFWELIQKCSLLIGLMIGITVLILKVDKLYQRFFRKKDKS